MATPTTRRRTAGTRKKKSRAKPAARRWSQRVTRSSDAMDLAPGVFTLRSAAAIARSLKRSVERSTRRKSPPFRSAMSMLNFEINRAGRGMPATRRRTLESAKDELRRLFHREPKAAARRRPAAKKKSPARSRKAGSARGQ